MPEKVEFNVNKFVNGSPEKTNTNLPAIPEVVSPVPVSLPIEVPKKKTSSKKKDGIDPKAVGTAQTSIDYLTHNVPYQQAYADEVAALDEVITQTNMVTLETMADMQSVRSSRTIKNKHGLLIGLTENITALLNTKMAAIRDKIKVIDNINNLELKRLKDTKIDAATQDENVRLQQMYTAFVNAPAGMVSGGGPMTALGPTPMNMMMNSVTPIQQAIIGEQTSTADVDAWQNGLDPAKKRMMMIASGRLDVVLMYDEATGVRRYAAIDKQTGMEVQGVELPDPNTAYDLDVHISPASGNWAKDNRINKIYPVVLIGNGSMQQY